MALDPAESTVRAFVRDRRQELGVGVRVFVPSTIRPGPGRGGLLRGVLRLPLGPREGSGDLGALGGRCGYRDGISLFLRPPQQPGFDPVQEPHEQVGQGDRLLSDRGVERHVAVTARILEQPDCAAK